MLFSQIKSAIVMQFHWVTIYGIGMHARNKKQFGCLNFLSVKHNWKFKKQKYFLFAKQKFPAR
jgi:hypothetical protein